MKATESITIKENSPLAVAQLFAAAVRDIADTCDPQAIEGYAIVVWGEDLKPGGVNVSFLAAGDPQMANIAWHESIPDYTRAYEETRASLNGLAAEAERQRRMDALDAALDAAGPEMIEAVAKRRIARRMRSMGVPYGDYDREED